MMVAIPELDGAINPMVFGGRSSSNDATKRDMAAHPERAAALANRVAKLVALRRSQRAERRVAIVLFNFPPNAGATGTAAYLAVFKSLFNTLTAMKTAGYDVEIPADVDTLRSLVVDGGTAYGQDGSIAARVNIDDHVRRQPWLAEIEATWGPAPGKHNTDGASLFVLGRQFGNVFVGLQPAFGFEGDPMRLLFERGFAPTHAFCAFLPLDHRRFPGRCRPPFRHPRRPGIHARQADRPLRRLLARPPHRRPAQRQSLRLQQSLRGHDRQAPRRRDPDLLSHAPRRPRRPLPRPARPEILHRPLAHHGARHRRRAARRPRHPDPGPSREREPLDCGWRRPHCGRIDRIAADLLELEYTLIPHGLHVIGEPPNAEERAATLDAAGITDPVERARLDALLATDHELPAVIHALDGGYVRPAPGGDILRTTDVLPTGRNLHGFDPFRIPSQFATGDGARQADRLLARHMADGAGLPETIAMVLWGTDNLKSEGGPIAQALWLMGAAPRFDSYGRLCGAKLIPLAELGRARVDVVITLSGIFRDLLPLQTKLLAEAALLAAQADETDEQNYIRKHALAFMAAQGGTLEQAALRVFGNADGAYGANVNQMVGSGVWNDEDELADAFTTRKGFAYGVDGRASAQKAVLQHVLSSVEATYQNLDSIELGVTTVDHYFDTLGGVSRAVRQARGGVAAQVYIGDQTRGDGTVRTLSEQVSLETRTRALNPKWYEALLKHGYEGVREIDAHVTNTLGWSATTGEVSPWVYQQLAETYVLDDAMRERLAQLNPKASAKIAGRLIEAHERRYWTPDDATVEALRRASEELEDRLEGIDVEIAA